MFPLMISKIDRGVLNNPNVKFLRNFVQTEKKFKAKTGIRI